MDGVIFEPKSLKDIVEQQHNREENEKRKNEKLVKDFRTETVQVGLMFSDHIETD